MSFQVSWQPRRGTQLILHTVFHHKWGTLSLKNWKILLVLFPLRVHYQNSPTWTLLCFAFWQIYTCTPLHQPLWLIWLTEATNKSIEFVSCNIWLRLQETELQTAGWEKPVTLTLATSCRVSDPVNWTNPINQQSLPQIARWVSFYISALTLPLDPKN